MSDLSEQPDLSGLDIERTIFRVPRTKDHPYLMVAKAAIRDRRVSLAARALLMVMLSQPDDWQFNVRHLAREVGCGRTMVAQLLRELIDAGYVRR